MGMTVCLEGFIDETGGLYKWLNWLPSAILDGEMLPLGEKLVVLFVFMFYDGFYQEKSLVLVLSPGIGSKVIPTTFRGINLKTGTTTSTAAKHNLGMASIRSGLGFRGVAQQLPTLLEELERPAICGKKHIGGNSAKTYLPSLFFSFCFFFLFRVRSFFSVEFFQKWEPYLHISS